MAKFTDIPEEVVTEHIARGIDDIQALRSGSLICRKFTSAFQRFLFTDIDLREDHTNISQRFANIAMESRHLFSYIQTFSVYISTTTELDLLITVLSCAKVQGLSVTVYSYSSEVAAVLPSIVKHPLVGLSLTGLTLNHIPLSSLSQCCYLKHLSLYSIIRDFGEHNLPLLKPGELAVRLESFRTTVLSYYHVQHQVEQKVSEWLAHPKCPLDILNVKALRMPNHVWEPMKGCAKVETIRIDFVSSSTRYELLNALKGSIADYSFFPNIRMIHLNITMHGTAIYDSVDESLAQNFTDKDGNPFARVVHILISYDIIERDSLAWLEDIFEPAASFGDPKALILFHWRGYVQPTF